MQIFFLHIPKTGGTTINSLLSQMFPSGNIYETPDNQAILQEIDRIPVSGIITGHLFYPFSEILSSSAFKLTLLRDPVDRVISAYEYVQRTSSHPLHAELRYHGSRGLLHFLSAPELTFHSTNLQARMLGASYPFRQMVGDLRSGRLTLSEAKGAMVRAESRPCTSSILDRALENLQHFNAVGLLERINVFAGLLCARLGKAKPQQLPHEKRAPLRELRHEEVYGPHVVSTIRELNEFDVVLYDSVRNALDRIEG